MLKKRPFLVVLFVALWVFVGAGGMALAQKSPQVPLAPNLIPKFVNQLPLLSIDNTKPAAQATMQTVAPANGALTLGMYPFKAQVLPPGTPLTDNPLTVGFGPDATGSTYVFGYSASGTPSGIQDTYIGPVLVNVRNNPFAPSGSTNIRFENHLGNTGDSATPIWYKYATDQTLHWADPLGINAGIAEGNYCFEQAKLGVIPAPSSPCSLAYDGPIAAVPHIHGGEVPAELDGGPDAWFTSDGLHAGHAYYSADGPFVSGKNYAIYKYPNTQEAGNVWYHDHLLGGTRLNVFAGLAGAYLIIDPTLTLPPGMNMVGLNNGTLSVAGLTGVELIVPLAIQDRMFDTEGQFFYQSDSAGNILWATNPEHPYWTPEFIGDVILVNGKAWPNLNVEPKRYRFLLINGSNARTYELSIPKGPKMYVIGTDGGYLDTAAMTNKLVIMPGERYDVIMDFAGSAGKKLIMRNTARAPYPGGVPTNNDTGTVMQFTVAAAAAGFVDNSYNPALTPAIRQATPVDQRIVRLPTTGYTPALTRQLTLNEVLNPPKIVTDPVTGVLNTAYPGGPLEILVNNTGYGGLNRSDFTTITTPIPGTTGSDTTYYSEVPQEGTTEMWEIVNLTADAHPIHLHLVQYQIINRQNYRTSQYVKAYNAAFAGGGYIPGNGPPLIYSPTLASGMKLGGNPDVTPFLSGMAMPPLPQEAGWKDTVVAYPGQVTRIAVRWAPTDVPVAGPASALAFAFSPSSDNTFPHGWVWHCHIVDHEDNEMMRPFTVNDNSAAPPAASRAVVKGTAF